MSNGNDFTNPEYRKAVYKKVLSIVLSKYAFLLRDNIARILYTTLRDDNRLDSFISEYMDPNKFLEIFPAFLDRDIQKLIVYWCALNRTQQENEHTEWTIDQNPFSSAIPSSKTHAKIPPDTATPTIREQIKEILPRALRDEYLFDIGEIVLRHSQIYNNMTSCSINYFEMKKSGSNKEAQKNFLKYWTKMFSVLISPVKMKQDKDKNEYRLTTITLPPEYDPKRVLFPSMDETAYSLFCKYVEGELKSIQCDDYRKYMNSGLRSLHPYYYNDLISLMSCGDHPAALLLGCRSGAQFQLISQNNIIGMVSLYFPLYDLWDQFGCTGDGFLMGHFDATKFTNSNRVCDYTKIDESYRKLWQNKLEGSTPIPDLAQLIIQPLQNEPNGLLTNVVTLLEHLPANTDAIPNMMTGKPPGEDIDKSFNALGTDGFNLSLITPLEKWLQFLLGFGENPYPIITEEVNHLDSQEIKQKHWEDWKKAIDLNSTYINLSNSKSKIKVLDFLENNFWNNLDLLFSKLKIKQSNIEFNEPTCTASDGKKSHIRFDVFCFHGYAKFSADGDVSEVKINEVDITELFDKTGKDKEIFINKLTEKLIKEDVKIIAPNPK